MMRKKGFSVFPNLTIEAEYHALSQCISYNEMSREDYQYVMKDPFNADRIHKTKTLIHEITHYVDHISTLQGQYFLANIYDGFNILVNKKTQDSELWPVIKLYKEIKDLKYDTYYKVEEKKSGGKISDWSFRSIIDCKLDQHGNRNPFLPILYNKFKYKGKSVAQVPFSIEALWETSAMAEENKAHLIAIGNCEENSDEMFVESSLWTNAAIEWIYNSEMLTYSSATHLVSGLLNIGELYRCFLVSKTLSMISLNIPYKYYEGIPTPKKLDLEQRGPINYLKFGDPSCIFFLLVKNIQHSGEKVITDEYGVDIEKILSINKLPRAKILDLEIENEMNRIGKGMLSGEYSSQYREVKEKGIDIFKQLGVSGGGTIHPQFYLDISDSCPLIFSEEQLEDENPLVKKYLEVFELEEKMREYSKASEHKV